MTRREGAATPPGLAALRGRIERADDALLALLVRRARLARQVGVAKQRAGLPVLDPAREAAVVRRAAARARKLGLPAEEVRRLFWQVIALCRAEQLPRSAATRGARRQ
jgi:chorismate mutase/prephenate dehydratase